MDGGREGERERGMIRKGVDRRRRCLFSYLLPLSYIRSTVSGYQKPKLKGRINCL